VTISPSVQISVNAGGHHCAALNIPNTEHSTQSSSEFNPSENIIRSNIDIIC
jgi:hypothetical protein